MDILVWLFQLFVFFSVVSGILGSISKKNKKPSSNKRTLFNEQTYSGSSSADQAPHQNKPISQSASGRNRQTRSAADGRTRTKEITSARDKRRAERERTTRERTHRDRVPSFRRQSQEPIIQEITTLKGKKTAKKTKSNLPEFDRKSMVKAMIYKEILDKPLSVRDE